MSTTTAEPTMPTKNITSSSRMPKRISMGEVYPGLRVNAIRPSRQMRLRRADWPSEAICACGAGGWVRFRWSLTFAVVGDLTQSHVPLLPLVVMRAEEQIPCKLKKIRMVDSDSHD
jgi:hypothetical protein